jgi:tetratricopeptide (TPR) repeat protein
MNMRLTLLLPAWLAIQLAASWADGAAASDTCPDSTAEPNLEIDTRAEPDRLRCEAQLLVSRAALERKRGNNAQAAADYADAQNIFGRLDDDTGRAAALLALGDVDRELGEYDYAVQAYDQARQLFRKLGDSLGEAHTLSGLGEVEWELGDRDLAQRDFEAAAQLYAAAGQSDRAAWAQQQADHLAE